LKPNASFDIVLTHNDRFQWAHGPCDPLQTEVRHYLIDLLIVNFRIQILKNSFSRWNSSALNEVHPFSTKILFSKGVPVRFAPPLFYEQFNAASKAEGCKLKARVPVFLS